MFIVFMCEHLRLLMTAAVSTLQNSIDEYFIIFIKAALCETLVMNTLYETEVILDCLARSG